MTFIELATGTSVAVGNLTAAQVVAELNKSPKLVEFSSQQGPVFVNPAHVVRVYAAD